jgi:hypothetical protein
VIPGQEAMGSNGALRRVVGANATAIGYDRNGNSNTRMGF